MSFGVIKVRRYGSVATVESCLQLGEWERWRTTGDFNAKDCKVVIQSSPNTMAVYTHYILLVVI